MSILIPWLDDPAATPDRVGGKGASLARLGAAGFPVPPGFCVPVEGYQEFHAAYDLDDAMAALTACTGRPAPAEVRAACEPILAKLEGAVLPGSVSKAVGEAFGELQRRASPGASFAVRSSGVSEDGAGASFAGLYESYLNLTSREAVLKAVLDCYGCLWQPRAAHYRTIKGIDHRKEAMAVVVMQTVLSAASGVAFTRNPVTGASDEVLINASWGLGEAVVAGLVTPDNYIAMKDGAIARKDVFDKHIRVVPANGGTAHEEVPEQMRNAQTLSDEQISLVATTSAAVERHYGVPVDVEFAFDAEGRFYLLQARPITTH